MKMQYGLLGIVAVMAVATPARAEDTWTGFNLYGVGMTFDGETDHANSGTPEQSLQGGFFGLGAGYDHQFGPFVLGVGADIAWGNASDTVDDGNYIDLWGKVSRLSTLYARFGVVVHDNMLLYAMGGVSQAEFTQGESCPDPAAVQFGFCRPAAGHAPFYLEEEQTLDGTTFGGGVELALAGNWHGRIEYRQDDFDEVTYILGPDASGNPLPASPKSLDGERFVFGLSYNF